MVAQPVGLAACVGSTWFIGPDGSDARDGRSETSAFKTFGTAFSAMAPGDTLILLDGTYSEDAGTGSMTWQSALGGQIPSGVSREEMTCVMAQHPGSVTVDGELFVGRSFEQHRFIYLEGITFEGAPANFYNADNVAARACGFHSETNDSGGVLNTGTNDRGPNDEDLVSSNLLFEDIWVWGKERVGLIVYRSHDVVIRRAVVRLDGCDSHALPCGDNNGNSMVGTTVYNSHHVSIQDVLILDSRLGPGGYEGASDIQTAWHDNFFHPFGANEWLGVLSLNSELAGMFPEVDDMPGLTAYQPLFTYRDIVIAGAADGVSAQSQGNPGSATRDLVIDGLTVLDVRGGDAFRVGPQFEATVTPTNLVRNVIALGPARFGMNSAIPPSDVDVAGTFTQGAYNQTECTAGCLTSDPRMDGPTPSLQYLVRIEPGSLLKGAGANGADIGANIVNRVGRDGSFFGDDGYNAPTTEPLWPWPHQDRIKAQMCSGVTTGFCAKASLSHAVWEYLGNPCPAGTCG